MNTNNVEIETNTNYNVEIESSECDCPICLENIDGVKNKTTTDCGHSFHTSCIMKNVAHNGFGCPYCRTVMAENPHTDEASEYTYLDMEESEDYVMRGMRFMFQRAEGEDFDEEDIEDEDYDQEQLHENSESVSRDDVRRPPTYDHSYESVIFKLAERGVTPENILKSLLYNFTAYCNNSEYEMIDSHVTDIIADILSVPEYEGHQRII